MVPTKRATMRHATNLSVLLVTVWLLTIVLLGLNGIVEVPSQYVTTYDRTTFLDRTIRNPWSTIGLSKSMPAPTVQLHKGAVTLPSRVQPVPLALQGIHSILLDVTIAFIPILVASFVVCLRSNYCRGSWTRMLLPISGSTTMVIVGILVYHAWGAYVWLFEPAIASSSLMNMIDGKMRCVWLECSGDRTGILTITAAGNIVFPSLPRWAQIVHTASLGTIKMVPCSIMSVLILALLCRHKSTSHCSFCDYPLVGLSTNRCPECGHVFRDCRIG